MLDADRDWVSDRWEERLGENTLLENLRLQAPAANPVRFLMHDLLRVLAGELPTGCTAPTEEEIRQLTTFNVWQIGLAHGTEAFLTGEVVVREWIRGHLPLGDEEQLQMFEIINRAFQRLYRFHTLHYCDACRSSLTRHPVRS